MGKPVSSENMGLVETNSFKDASNKIAEVTLVTRKCRRAPLTNISNNQRSHAVLKKPKRSVVSPSKQSESREDSYLDDIVNYLIAFEQEIGICPHYMDKQHDLQPVMRSILVDWIIQACTKFKVTDETQYYTIQYIDRFLSVNLIERSNLQLVGIGALFIACKFEEIIIPSMSDLCYITEDTYTPKELERIENKILKALDYDLGYPTAIQFLRYIVKVLSCSRQEYYCGKFLCELMSVSYSALRWKPSEIAVASLDILNDVSTFIPALKQLVNLSFNENSISECKRFMRNIILQNELSDYPTVFTKYDSVYNKLKSELK